MHAELEVLAERGRQAWRALTGVIYPKIRAWEQHGVSSRVKLLTKEVA